MPVGARRAAGHSRSRPDGRHESPNFNRAGMYLMNMASGTSMNPDSWPMPMLMTQAGSWTLMFMGQAFLVDTQQSGPRGGDKLYSTNWVMASAQHIARRAAASCSTDAQPGAGHRHGSALPAAVPDRRNGLRAAAGGRAASARFRDGPGRALRASAGRDTHAALLLRAGGRSGARTGGVPASRVGGGAAASDPGPPLAGFHAHRRQRGDGGHHARWSGWKPAASTAGEPDENRWNIDWGPMDSWSARFPCSLRGTGRRRSRRAA